MAKWVARVPLTLVICASIFFVVRWSLGLIPKTIETFGSCAAYPFLLMQRKITQPIQAYFCVFRNAQNLQQQLEDLKGERDRLQKELIKYESIKQLYQEIAPLVRFANRYNVSSMCCAQILLRSLNHHEQTVLIDKGSRHGVKENMVAVYKNCLLGRIMFVYPYYSRVLLITDKRCQVACYCARTRTKGIYRGANCFDKGFLGYVGILNSLSDGERVISSGKGLVFPRGFGIGTIHTYEKKDLYYQIAIKPLINVYDIDFCYLVLKGETDVTGSFVNKDSRVKEIYNLINTKI